MIHRRGCEGVPALDHATHVGATKWLIFRCTHCRAVELREQTPGRATEEVPR